MYSSVGGKFGGDSHIECENFCTYQMLKDGPKTFTQMPKEKKTLQPPQNSSVDSDDENWTLSPELRLLRNHQSVSDAIQAALESVTLQDSTGKYLL